MQPRTYRKHLRSGLETLVLTLLLASCVTAGAGKPQTACPPPDNRAMCAAFAPILVSKDDVLTDGTAKQILAHNLTGEVLCGWNPKGNK